MAVDGAADCGGTGMAVDDNGCDCGGDCTRGSTGPEDDELADGPTGSADAEGETCCLMADLRGEACTGCAGCVVSAAAGTEACCEESAIGKTTPDEEEDAAGVCAGLISSCRHTASACCGTCCAEA